MKDMISFAMHEILKFRLFLLLRSFGKKLE